MTQEPADSGRPGTRAQALVAPAARERVIEVLTRSFVADEITEAELEVRIDRAYLATTDADLDAIVADLPAAAQAPAAASVPAARADVERIAALFSGQERRMMGAVPRRLAVRARLGYVELDLTRATFEPGVTQIDVRAFIGYVQIRLPPGVHVESGGHALFGFFTVRGPSAPSAGGTAAVVRITGRAMFGFAECFAGAGRPRLEGPTE